MLAEGNCDLVGVGAGGGVWAMPLILNIPFNLPYKLGKLQKTYQECLKSFSHN